MDFLKSSKGGTLWVVRGSNPWEGGASAPPPLPPLNPPLVGTIVFWKTELRLKITLTRLSVHVKRNRTARIRATFWIFLLPFDTYRVEFNIKYNKNARMRVKPWLFRLRFKVYAVIFVLCLIFLKSSPHTLFEVQNDILRVSKIWNNFKTA